MTRQSRAHSVTRRLLLVHAHPDDESITTGGTIAHYLAHGVDVAVVTCTLGEEGEVMEPAYGLLTSEHADQLGGYRIAELTRALTALSYPDGPVLTPLFLGSAGRWRDSGMAGTPAAEHPRAFASAPIVGRPDGPVAALVQIVRQLRPQVVVTYDQVGGYGHPDHIAAHQVTVAAIDAAADPAFADPVAGEPWRVDKLYWTVTGEGQLGAGLSRLPHTGLPPEWTIPDASSLPSHPDHALTTVIDVAPVAERKAAAMRAHATQLQVNADGTGFALTNLVAQPILTEEAYILARGSAAPGADGLEHDLFAGLACLD